MLIYHGRRRAAPLYYHDYEIVVLYLQTNDFEVSTYRLFSVTCGKASTWPLPYPVRDGKLHDGADFVPMAPLPLAAIIMMLSVS